MNLTPLLTIVLAAGKGTRMKSAMPKVLHRVGGLSLLGHVLQTAKSAGEGRVAVVMAPELADVRAEALSQLPEASVFLQEQQLGTAHAVLAARETIGQHSGDVLVVFGDTPFLQPKTLQLLRGALADGTPLAVLGFEASDPTGYGRMLRDAGGNLVAIREEKDASDEERKVTFCCSGVMAFRAAHMLDILDQIGHANAQGEYYLTDAVAVARSKGFRVAAISCPEEEVLGINSRAQLAGAEAVFQRRARDRALAKGATLIDPATVWFSYDTKIGQDVIIEPNVFFGAGVTVEDDVQIRANSHVEGAVIRRGARIGPFARLRPGSDIGPDVHIGNFVEVKNVVLGAGAKANHLAYLGDGSVGEGANIGAGTIFCNYDGFNKNRTVVGAGAFIGSNSALVAPIKIGDGAYIGSGSVITRDVPADALALERSPQDVRPGWAAKFRAMMLRRQSPRSK